MKKSHACTCPSVLSRAAPHPETPQPQQWRPRRQEGGSAPTKCPTSLQGICGGHLDTSQQCLLVFPLRSLGRPQSAPICLPPCGRERSSDLLTVASRRHYRSLHLIEIKAHINCCMTLYSFTLML